MQASWRLALNNLAGRPGRNVLLAIAVALATALVVTVSAVIGSAHASVIHRLTRALGTTDARVLHQFNGRFDESVLETVRAWDEVEVATGSTYASLTLVAVDGPERTPADPPRRVSPVGIGVEWDLQPRFRELELDAGRLPAPDAPHEILVDPIVADRLEVGVGDHVRVQRFGPPIDLEIVGIFARPVFPTMQKPWIRLDRKTLAEAANRTGRLTRIAIICREGVDVRAFCERRQADLDEHETPLAVEPAEMIRTGLDRQLAITAVAFTVVAVIAFLACAFIVATGMTTAVTERQRELAIMRCLGAHRRQLFAGQVLAAVAITAGGALVGIPAGLGLAWIIVQVFSELLPAGLHVAPSGIALAATGAIGAGVIGSMFAAWQAGRVQPLAALAVRAAPPSRRGLLTCIIAGLALISVQVGIEQLPTTDQRFWAYVGFGVHATHVGYFLLAVPIFALTAMLSAPLLARVLALPRNLLLDAARATPYRMGLTSGALMVGMSVLVVTWTGGHSLVGHLSERVRFADGFAYRSAGMSEALQQRIADMPQFEEVCPIGYLPVRVLDREVHGVAGLTPQNVICVGFDPDRFFAMNRIEWIQGDATTAIPRLREGDAILVADQFLVAKGIGVGDTLTLGGPRRSRTFEIVGVVSSAGLDVATQFFGIRSAYFEAAVNCVFMDFGAVAETFDTREAVMMQVNIADGFTDEEILDEIETNAPGVLFASGRFLKEQIAEIGAALMTVAATVAFLGLVLACFGVGNVIAAGITARRFEFGVLRAMGGGSGLLARMIVGEAILMGIGGAVTGTLLGLQLTLHEIGRYADLAGLRVAMVIPFGPIAIGWLVVIGMTVVAALPAAASLLRKRPRELLAH